MSRHAAARLGWSLWAICVVLTLASLVLAAIDWRVPVAGSGSISNTVYAFLEVGFLAFPTVGALVAARYPGNSIGWIFCAVGVTVTASGFAQEYGVRALIADPGSLPLGVEMAWLSEWLFLPGLILAGTLLLLLFPDGRLPSPRWRPVSWLAGVAIVALSLSSALEPGPLPEDPFKFVQNPFGVEGVKTLIGTLAVFWFVMMAVGVAAAFALARRFRRARAEERAQLKWFALAGALLVASIVLSAITFKYAAEIGQVLILIAAISIPVTAGVAILKYRLYEIDLIIRRTLVYGALSALLAGLYFGIVLALQQAFSPITQGLELAVAGSTLAVAALFRPARRRIQDIVDRRFYRSKVDAARTLEAFSARLRREIDLEALSGALRSAVDETMRPAHASLWLRSPGGRP